MAAKKTTASRHRHKQEVKKDEKGPINQHLAVEKDSVPVPDKIPIDQSQNNADKPGVVEVRGLPHFFIESDLKEWLGQIGTINRVHIIRSKRTGHSTGRGFIEFGINEVAQLVSTELKSSVIESYTIVLKHRPDISSDPDIADKVFKYCNRAPPKSNRAKIGSECVLRSLNMDLEAKRRCREKFIVEIAKAINVDPMTIHRPESVTAY